MFIYQSDGRLYADADGERMHKENRSERKSVKASLLEFPPDSDALAQKEVPHGASIANAFRRSEQMHGSPSYDFMKNLAIVGGSCHQSGKVAGNPNHGNHCREFR